MKIMIPRAQIDELFSDDPEKYRKDYAKTLNKAYCTMLRYERKPTPHDKEWYVAFNLYDAQFFDAEMYAKELREVTGDNGWRFDVAREHQDGMVTVKFTVS